VEPTDERAREVDRRTGSDDDVVASGDDGSRIAERRHQRSFRQVLRQVRSLADRNAVSGDGSIDDVIVV
jgi:hypothetical protein